MWPRLKIRIRQSLRVFSWALLGVFGLGALFVLVFATGSAKPREDVRWGVNFSQKHTENFGLDWKVVYRALFEELGAKRVKLAAHWDRIEPERSEYDFKDMDWMIDQAAKSGATILPVIGMKTPRWPECHIPEWAKSFERGPMQAVILEYIEAYVNRYKDNPAVIGWQVENEPFFVFGDCPWYDPDFYAKEIALVRQLDPSREVTVSDTGEFSLWWSAAQLGDRVGTTMYRKVWFSSAERYVSYPIPPQFYKRRAWVVDKLFGKEVFNAELQAEPWGPYLYYEMPIEEQMKTMDFDQFRANIEYAKQTGLPEAYFWGAEWWYWMKVKNGMPEYWEEAKKLDWESA